jgi:hypothetical protein
MLMPEPADGGTADAAVDAGDAGDAGADAAVSDEDAG